MDVGIAKAGTLFYFSEGEYSDYGYVGHFLALEDVHQPVFDQAKDNIREKVLKSETYQDELVKDMSEHDWSCCYRDMMIGELIRMGKVMVIDCYGFHLGAYGRCDL